MNCYTNECGNKFYCLNPINLNNIYFLQPNNSKYYLFCYEGNFKNLIHREDGPAIEWVEGNKAWIYHGELINCKDNDEFLKIMKMMAFL